MTEWLDASLPTSEIAHGKRTPLLTSRVPPDEDPFQNTLAEFRRTASAAKVDYQVKRATSESLDIHIRLKSIDKTISKAASILEEAGRSVFRYHVSLGLLMNKDVSRLKEFTFAAAEMYIEQAVGNMVRGLNSW